MRLEWTWVGGSCGPEEPEEQAVGPPPLSPPQPRGQQPPTARHSMSSRGWRMRHSAAAVAATGSGTESMSIGSTPTWLPVPTYIYGPYLSFTTRATSGRYRWGQNHFSPLS